MQNIIIEKPYRFIPPKRGKILPDLLRRFYLPRYLRESHGVEVCKFLGLDKLKSSIAGGNGIILAPNHCRPCDPVILGLMAGELSTRVFIMASWHLFMQSPVMGWLLPRIGVFSMYREGLDRDAIRCAIDIIAEGERPLVIFPEGVISRTNDRLNNLMDGTLFIARNAAKRRSDLGKSGKTVIHPVAIRYFYGGDIDASLRPALEDIEKRLTWKERPEPEPEIRERIGKIGQALLALKEMEYLGSPQDGPIHPRIAVLIDRILVPLEDEWTGGSRGGTDVISRVKAVRAAILPEMIAGDMAEEERSRRWSHLKDLYLAQQLSLYPPDYVGDPPEAEHLLETVERFEEDLTDAARIYRPIYALGQIGDAIEVPAARDRSAGGEPQMAELRRSIENMLAEMKGMRNVFQQ